MKRLLSLLSALQIAFMATVRLAAVHSIAFVSYPRPIWRGFSFGAYYFYFYFWFTASSPFSAERQMIPA